MLAKTVLCALLGLSAMAEASVIGSSPYDSMIGRRAARALEARKGKATTSTTGATATTNANTGNNNAASNSCLAANAVQTGSANDGSFNATAGQSLSKTDTANFINFCEGKTLTNGLQVKAGSCNGVTMGQIPASTNMISAVIVFPQNGQTISANQDFNLQVQVSNLVAGSFTNAASTYYSAPQALDSSTGNVIGHTHLVVQNTGSSLNPTTPMDPTTFAFFKGIDDAGNGKGLLSAAVAGGLPVGNYRLCSMTSASNHQPVLMPVAQRGAQDDCVRFTVAAGKNTNTGSTTTAAAAAAATTTKAAGKF
ncbi:hypothetical protein BX600DRAFT_316625 [Xylariales sp. PMI_506]|nr:hypothetical protein BX600DRAFT_316625 [Xylariales sp. PMI_506]